MLLVLTNSMDMTADTLFQRFGHSAFRWNFDLWRDYSLVLQPDRWEIGNPAGLKITSETATHAFWWKPWSRYISTKDDDYIVSELKYAFRELYGWFLRRGLVVGSSPDFHNRLGKLNLLEIASRYFRIPSASVVGWNLPAQLDKFPSEQLLVAKSLASEPTSDRRLMYTVPVGYEKLDRTYPWFLQTEVDATHDVTVVVCGHKFFAFWRSRKDLKGLDCRRAVIDEDPENPSWGVRPLSEDEYAALRGFCDELGMEWGRLDFLQDECGLIFLEFNANGQWAWLDLNGHYGLMDAVVSYLSTPPTCSELPVGVPMSCELKGSGEGPRRASKPEKCVFAERASQHAIAPVGRPGAGKAGAKREHSNVQPYVKTTKSKKHNDYKG